MEPAAKGSRPREDVVAAVRAKFSAKDANDVISWLSRLDSDRLQVAVLISATWDETPNVSDIRRYVELAFVDFRDVLMVEYTPRVDYKAALASLGLVRPYPL